MESMLPACLSAGSQGGNQAWALPVSGASWRQQKLLRGHGALFSLSSFHLWCFWWHIPRLPVSGAVMKELSLGRGGGGSLGLHPSWGAGTSTASVKGKVLSGDAGDL